MHCKRLPNELTSGGLPQVIVQEWMTTELHTVKPRDSVAHARALLQEHRINQFPVMVNRRLVGIVTDRNLRDAVNTMRVSALEALGKAAPAQDPDTVTVEAVMTANVITVRPQDTMKKAAELMRRERIGALPVLQGAAVRGILTRSDVLAAFLAPGEPGTKGKRSEAREKPVRKPRSTRRARR
jgi:acetoin utilization protein AcuB